MQTKTVTSPKFQFLPHLLVTFNVCVLTFVVSNAIFSSDAQFPRTLSEQVVYFDSKIQVKESFRADLAYRVAVVAEDIRNSDESPVLIKKEKSKVLHTSKSEELCLAKVIFHEARDQSVRGKYAVADVTLNRAESGGYPDSICSVIIQKGQYSGYSKRSAKVPDDPKSQEAWKVSKAIAVKAIRHRNTTVPKNVLYFHAVHVKPKWVRKLQRITRIDDHVFYAPIAKSS
jgi:spore germination cell wall hydrolase CwlJ-like protein